MPENDLARISTRIVRRAKLLLEKECARRRRTNGGRVSEGVIITEALLTYFGEVGDGQRPTSAADGQSRDAA
jgi:hypothetical protein